jgi:DNA-binding protein YbaB
MIQMIIRTGILFVWSVVCLTVIENTAMSCDALIIPTQKYSTTLSSPSTTSRARLSAFLWFGGNDDDDKENNKDDDDEENNKKIAANLKGVSNIMNSMSGFKTSQRVGERTALALQDLSNTLVEGTAADGKIKITFNGQQVPVSVQIDESYFKSLLEEQSTTNNKENEILDELTAALTQAMKEAHSKSGSKIEDKLKALYSELGFES